MDEQSIFLEALEKPSPEAQDAWLEEACGEDESLKRRLKQMLQRHGKNASFLEQPAPGLEDTLVPDASEGDRAASLDAGLALSFDGNAAVVIGDANHSVLRSLGNTLNEIPRVALRESAAEGADPISRPGSPEIPQHDSDSRYRLDGEIARGGMGAIIKGRDTDLGRDLAIKVLLDSHKDKPEVIQRFVEEAQIGGQLQHPGIAPIYELGQFNDKRPFFAMKLVKGQTLSKLLADREDAADERGKLIGIFEQICQTMAYAHSRGVIHRDLKPANIMVGAFGEVQVMDWGLAKVLSLGGVADEKKSRDQAQGQSIIQTMRSVGSDSPGTLGAIGSQTQMGSVMGTPAYMPPEQALGEIDQMDERADVFGLGAILCEILTGQPPYVADDGTRIFRLASRGKLDDAFSRLDGCGADEDLIALTKHCLELEPVDRPRDASALAERVTAYLESVEAKLRGAEVERAAEAARADAEASQAAAERQRAEAESARASEESKRRRISLALAAMLLVGLIAAGYAATHFRSLEETQRILADKNEKLADDRESERLAAVEARKVADRERSAAKHAEAQMEQTAAKATQEREIAERENYRSTIRLAESMLQGDEQARYRVADLLWQAEPELRGWEWGYLMARCPLEEWSLQTNQGGLDAIAASADGQYLATAGSDGTVALWDTWTRKELWRQKTGRIDRVVIDPQSRFVAISDRIRDVALFRILKASTGEVVHESPTIGNADIDFSADGKSLYTLTSMHLSRIRVSDWEQVAVRENRDRWEYPGDFVAKLFVDTSGSYVGVNFGFYFEELVSQKNVLFDAETLEQSEEFASILGETVGILPVSRPRFRSGAGNFVFSSASHVMEVSLAQKDQRELIELPSFVEFLVDDPRSQTVIAAANNGTIAVHSADGRETTWSHGASICDIASLQDGRVVSGGASGLLKCWNLDRTAQPIANRDMSPYAATASSTRVEFDSDGQRLLYHHWALEQRYLFDLSRSSVPRVFNRSKPLAYGKYFPLIRPATGELVMDHKDGLSFYDLDDDVVDANQTRHIPMPRPYRAAFDASGRFLIASTESGELFAFDLAHDTPLPLPDIRGTGVLLINPVGTRAVLMSDTGPQAWDVSTGQLLDYGVDQRDEASSFSVDFGAVFHPDGELIAVLDGASGTDSRIVLWDTTRGASTAAIEVESGVNFANAVFSPDGNRLFTSCTDAKCRVWDWKIGKELLALENMTTHGPVDVSADEVTVAYSGFNPSLRIAKALPWQETTRRDAEFYRALDDLRIESMPFVEPELDEAVGAEFLGDVHRRRGEIAEAIKQYRQAIEIRKQSVLDEPGETPQLSRLAQLYEKRIAIVSITGERAHDADLQRTVAFWQELAAEPKFPTLLWPTVFRFQMTLAEMRLARDPDVGNQSLEDCLDFWIEQFDQHPDDRMCVQFVRTLTQRRIRNHFDEGDLDWFETRAESHPVLAITLGDHFVQEEKHEQAIAYYSQAVALQANEATLLGKRAAAYLATEQWDLAGADLSLALQHAPETSQPGLAARLADVLTRPWIRQNWPEQFVHLGEKNEASGIDLVDERGDGSTEPAMIEAQACRRTTRPYAYFIIDDSFKTASKMDAIVEVEYWDDGEGWFAIQYDHSNDAYRLSPERISLTGTQQWRKARFTLENARFANSQNGHADFRVAVGGDALHLRRVSLQRVLPGTVWEKLAFAYGLKEDKQALDELLERHPEAVTSGAGDLLLAHQKWQQAINVYELLIAEQPTNFELLSRSARAHAALEHWDLAGADLSLALQHAPETSQPGLAARLADVLTRPWIRQNWPEQFVHLGEKNEASGIDLVDERGDGSTEPAMIEAQACRRTTRPYAYFIIDDSFKTATKMDAIVEVEYWDDGEGWFAIQYDHSNDAYRLSPERISLTGTQQWRKARFTLENARFANSQNGHADFRVARYEVAVEGEDLHLRRVSLQRVLSLTETVDAWGKLAVAYRLTDDKQALDKLLEQHPKAAAALGDVHLAKQEWQQAIDVYDSLITDQSTDANLLSHRAQAHAALEQWDRARADWSRATQLQPSRLDDAFKVFRNAGQWSMAAEFGQRLAEEKPKESMLWLRVSTVILLSGDETGYAKFCQWIAEQPVEGWDQAETAIKSSLLVDREFDISALPADALTDALESGNHPRQFGAWGWATRALLAYRSGDADSAVSYINHSNEHTPDRRISAINQSVLAMSLHEIGQRGEAQAALAKALQFIDLLNDDPNIKGHHDLLIAEILYREAEAKLNGKNDSSDEALTSPKKSTTTPTVKPTATK